MCKRARWYVAATLILGLGIDARGETDSKIDPDWLARATTECTAAYEKYKALATRLEEVCEIRTDKMPGAVGENFFRPQTRRERIVRLGDNCILERTRILDAAPNRSQIRLECDNSDYHFTLGKEKADSSYALVGYALGERRYLLSDQGGMLNSLFSVLSDALGAIKADGKHTLRRLQFDSVKKLLRIDFTSSTGSVEEQVYVDPGHDWRVVERRVETPSLVATERWTYGVAVGGLEFPTDFQNLTTYKVAKAPPNLKITGRLISLKITDKTPDDFRLSAFGMPEPVDAPPLEKSTRWYLWILAAAVLCGALSFGFAYLRRRRIRRAAIVVQGGKT
jgi:hypothetical protein